MLVHNIFKKFTDRSEYSDTVVDRLKSACAWPLHTVSGAVQLLLD